MACMKERETRESKHKSKVCAGPKVIEERRVVKTS